MSSAGGDTLNAGSARPIDRRALPATSTEGATDTTSLVMCRTHALWVMSLFASGCTVAGPENRLGNAQPPAGPPVCRRLSSMHGEPAAHQQAAGWSLCRRFVHHAEPWCSGTSSSGVRDGPDPPQHRLILLPGDPLKDHLVLSHGSRRSKSSSRVRASTARGVGRRPSPGAGSVVAQALGAARSRQRAMLLTLPSPVSSACRPRAGRPPVKTTHAVESGTGKNFALTLAL